MKRLSLKYVLPRDNGVRAGLNNTPYYFAEDLKNGDMIILAG